MTLEIRVCTHVALVILLAVSGTLTFASSGFSQRTKPDPCGQLRLPSNAKQALRKSYGSWTIQTAGLLSKTARERWSAEKPLSCPGAIQGRFFPSSDTTYVLLLVQRERPQGGYRIIAVDHESRTVVVEASDDQDSSNYFLHGVLTSRYFSREKAKKFRPQAKDSFLVIDSAEQEYGADLYFWTEGHFRTEPVDE
jgi:hypothetical protein